MSEALGTAIIILFGCGSVAMTVAALNQSDRGKLPFAASGDWLLITTGWGVGVALAVWVAGGVSGAHLNPAVTLAHALRRGFPWSKVPSYWAAQVFGAFVGAALIYLNYHDAISAVDAANKVTRGTPDSVATFSIFATFPAPYFSSPVGPLIDQIIGTGLLVLVIFAVIDAFQHARQGQPRAARGRPDRRGHRRLLRRQRGLRDQPRPRPRPPDPGLDRGLEVRGDPGRLRQDRLLHVGPDRGPDDRWRARRLPL
jgi:MIP family channel proteins